MSEQESSDGDGNDFGGFTIDVFAMGLVAAFDQLCMLRGDDTALFLSASVAAAVDGEDAGDVDQADSDVEVTASHGSARAAFTKTLVRNLYSLQFKRFPTSSCNCTRSTLPLSCGCGLVRMVRL